MIFSKKIDFNKPIGTTFVVDFYWDVGNPMICIAEATIYPYNYKKYDDGDDFGKGEKEYRFSDHNIIYTTERPYSTLFGKGDLHIKYNNNFRGESHESSIISVSSIEEGMQLVLRKIFTIKSLKK